MQKKYLKVLTATLMECGVFYEEFDDKLRIWLSMFWSEHEKEYQTIEVIKK